MKSTIVEGIRKEAIQPEFIKFLVYSPGANNEAIDHLETLYKTKSLQEETTYNYLHSKLDTLGRKINLFIKGVDDSDWRKPQ